MKVLLILSIVINVLLFTVDTLNRLTINKYVSLTETNERTISINQRVIKIYEGLLQNDKVRKCLTK